MSISMKMMKKERLIQNQKSDHHFRYLWKKAIKILFLDNYISWSCTRSSTRIRLLSSIIDLISMRLLLCISLILLCKIFDLVFWKVGTTLCRSRFLWNFHSLFILVLLFLNPIIKLNPHITLCGSFNPNSWKLSNNRTS